MAHIYITYVPIHIRILYMYIHSHSTYLSQSLMFEIASLDFVIPFGSFSVCFCKHREPTKHTTCIISCYARTCHTRVSRAGGKDHLGTQRLPTRLDLSPLPLFVSEKPFLLVWNGGEVMLLCLSVMKFPLLRLWCFHLSILIQYY